MDSPRIQRALISVSDKLGLAGFARGLAAAGVEIFSTGGTRQHLESEGIAVRDVSEYTGFPEMMDGRLKTLHPKVHGGILCRHDNPEDMKALAEHGILTFELVVVNLYPFEATVARKGVTHDEAIEQIDIGGPTLVRAAAKNHAFTTIATGAAQYSEILDQITAHGCTTLELRRRLAAEAFAQTARYDRAIADFFAGADRRGAFPRQRDDQHDPQDGAPLRREPAPAGGPVRPARRPGRQPRGRPATARQGTFLQQPAGPRRRPGHGPPVHRTGRRGRQAQQPLRRGRGRQPGRWPCSGHSRATRSSAFGSVLGPEPHGRRRHGRGADRPGPVRRGHRGPPLPRRRPGNPHHAAEVEEQRPADGGGRSGPLAGALDLPLPRRRRVDAGGRRAARPRRHLARRDRRRARPTSRCPICVSPGKWSATSSRTPSCSARTACCWARGRAR